MSNMFTWIKLGCEGTLLGTHVVLRHGDSSLDNNEKVLNGGIPFIVNLLAL